LRQQNIPMFDEHGQPLPDNEGAIARSSLPPAADAGNKPAAALEPQPGVNMSGNGFDGVQNAFQGRLVDHLASLPLGWQGVFDAPHCQETLRSLDGFLSARLAEGVTIFPLRPFRALLEVAPEDVQVVILGQDPYHGPNQAQGLAFSVPDICRTPPSLRNMFAELAQEYPGEYVRQRNSLVRWARQGVLLLNASLTVEAQQAGSHAKRGWEILTDAILLHVLRQPRPKVFLLWGAHAQSKQALLREHPPAGPVHILCANHPSPLSATRPPRPFMGCGHFRAANDWLQARGERGVDWLTNDVALAQAVTTA